MPSSGPPPPARRRDRVWLLLVVGAAAVVHGHGLGRLPLWRDEAASVDIAERSVPGIVAAVERIDLVHGLYYLLLHAVLVLGDSESVVRIPSLVASVAAVALTAELARRVLGPVPASVTAALLVCNPLLAGYAREARPYALAVMVVCAAALVLLGSDRPIGVARGAGAAALAVLAGYLHLFALLPVAGLFVGYLVATPHRPGPRGVLAAVACVGAALGPLVWTAAGQAGQVSWVRRPAPGEVEVLVQHLAGTGWTAVALGAVALAAIGAVALGPRRDAPRQGTPRDGTPRRETPRQAAGRGPVVVLAVAAGTAAVTGPLVLLVASWVGTPIYVERYVLPSAAMLALVAGAAVRSVGRPALVAGAVVLVGLSGLPAAWAGPASKGEDLRAAAVHLSGAALEGDCIAFDPSWARIGLDHYLSRIGPVALRDVALLPGAAPVGLFPAERSAPEVQAALAACSRVWVAGYPGPVGAWRPVPEVTGAALAAVRPGFTAAGPVSFGDLTLTRWEVDRR